MRRFGTFAFAVTLLVAARGLADEAPPAACLLRVVHALPEPGGVDATLKPLAARFGRPPFLHWKTFHLVKEDQEELRPGGTAIFQLPEGRKAHVVYTGHGERPSGRHVIRGSLSIDGTKSKSQTAFSLDEGGLFLVAGEQYENGILIYALSCKTEK